ncbi:hypothetical protein RhiirB3_457426, partial [Rhizophagus irregularis]
HTIENCFLKIVSRPLIINKKQTIKDAGILPLDNTDFQDEIKENEREENECKEIQDLIDKLEYIHPLTAEEYIKLDQENEITGETLIEEQLVAILKLSIVKTNDSVDGVNNNNMNRKGDKDNIMDVDNINFETLYFNEGTFIIMKSMKVLLNIKSIRIVFINDCITDLQYCVYYT